MCPIARFAVTFSACVAALSGANRASAQDSPEPPPEIIFQPGTGDPQTAPALPLAPRLPVRTSTITCTDLPAAQERVFAPYGKMEIATASA